MCFSLTITGNFLCVSGVQRVFHTFTHMYKECHTLCHVLTNRGGDSAVTSKALIICPCVRVCAYVISFLPTMCQKGMLLGKSIKLLIKVSLFGFASVC